MRTVPDGGFGRPSGADESHGLPEDSYCEGGFGIEGRQASGAGLIEDIEVPADDKNLRLRMFSLGL